MKKSSIFIMYFPIFSSLWYVEKILSRVVNEKLWSYWFQQTLAKSKFPTFSWKKQTPQRFQIHFELKSCSMGLFGEYSGVTYRNFTLYLVCMKLNIFIALANLIQQCISKYWSLNSTDFENYKMKRVKPSFSGLKSLLGSRKNSTWILQSVINFDKVSTQIFEGKEIRDIWPLEFPNWILKVYSKLFVK